MARSLHSSSNHPTISLWKCLLSTVASALAMATGIAAAEDNKLDSVHQDSWEVRDRQVWQELGYKPPPSARTAAYLDPNVDAANPSVDDPMVYHSPSRPEPPGRSGMFQKASLTATHLLDNDFGLTDFNFASVFALPAPTTDWPLIMTPGYSLYFLNGPDAVDMPARLHDIYFDVQWIVPVCNDFKVALGVTPGWYSDLETSNSDAFRLGAKAVGIYTWSQTLDLVFGATYLDRFDVEALPVVGVVWKPFDDWNFNLVFPQPKISHRTSCYGTSERWVYVAGEFGGGSWAIQRASGMEDMAAYRDWRFIVGVEQRLVGGPGAARLEVGYVFEREIEYRSGTPSFKPDSTVMFRGGLNF